MSEIMSDVEICNVKRISKNELGFSCSFPIMGRREAGVYRHKKALGELLPKHKDGKMSVYQLKVRATEPKEIEELIQLIKKGEIRPEPGGSYDNPPKGPSYEEMKSSYDEHVKAIADVEKQRDDFAERVLLLEKNLAIFNASYKKLDSRRNDEMRILGIIKDELMSRKWPYVSAKKTAERLKKIVDGYYS